MKPKLLPTLFTIPALIVLIALGTWQLQRLNWKNNIISEINEKSKLPPIELPANIKDIEKYQYRKIRLIGEFDHDKEVHLFTGQRVMRGDSGYDILTPLKMADDRTVLVDRGWVTHDKKNASNRPETLTKGYEEVIAMLHKGETQQWFTPNNDIAKNLWFWIDMNAIATYTGNNLENIYFRAIKKEGDDSLPIGGNAIIKQRNDHLQYVITWYSLALILLVIYFIYHRK